MREKPVLKAFNTVFRELDKVENAKWYLEKRRREEFGKKVGIEMDMREGEDKLKALEEAIKQEKKDG